MVNRGQPTTLISLQSGERSIAPLTSCFDSLSYFLSDRISIEQAISESGVMFEPLSDRRRRQGRLLALDGRAIRQIALLSANQKDLSAEFRSGSQPPKISILAKLRWCQLSGGSEKQMNDALRKSTKSNEAHTTRHTSQNGLSPSESSTSGSDLKNAAGAHQFRQLVIPLQTLAADIHQTTTESARCPNSASPTSQAARLPRRHRFRWVCVRFDGDQAQGMLHPQYGQVFRAAGRFEVRPRSVPSSRTCTRSARGINRFPALIDDARSVGASGRRSRPATCRSRSCKPSATG